MNTQLERALFTKTARQYPRTQSISWAIAELYGRRFSPIASMAIEGKVMATRHTNGETAVCVLGVKTAVYVRSHRAYLQYLEMYNDQTFPTGSFSEAKAQLHRLTSAINGLALSETEQQFLTMYYQELLAIS